MRKSKAALAIGLSVAMGLCGAGLVACNGDKGDNGNATTTAGEKSNYYLIGNFSDSALPADSDWNNLLCSTIDDVDDSVSLKTTTTENIYEVTVNLYQNDMFQVLQVGQSWTGQIGFSSLTVGEDEAFIEGDGYDVKNIKVAKDGKYKLTLTVSDTGNTITYEKVDDAPHIPVAVTGISLNSTEQTLGVGDTHQIVATVTPANADDKDNITYESDNTEVATVSSSGLVTAVAVGEATITVSCGDFDAELEITVSDNAIHATSVTLNKTSHAFLLGMTETLTATALPADTTDTASWTSSDSTVVSVENGTITALKEGTATITVTYGTQSATCEVTVAPAFYITGDTGVGDNVIYWGDKKVATDLDTSTILKPSTETPNVYSTQLNLYAGKGLKILRLGGAWSTQLDATKLASTDEDGKINLSDEVSGTENIIINKSGKYTVSMTEVEGEWKISFKCDEVFVQVVGLNKTAHTLVKDGNTFQIETTISPSDAFEKDNITYTSSDEGVATVSESGLVTSVASGTANITVSCGGKSATLVITVVDEAISATDVTISAENVAIVVGMTHTLTATAEPTNTTDSVSWTSSDPTVVSVEDGVVTALKEGTATITVSYGSVSKTCTVVVPKSYYAVGAAANGYLEWNSDRNFATVANSSKVVFTPNQTLTEWTLTIDLTEGDELKFLELGGGWSTELNGNDNNSSENNSSEVDVIDGGNFKIWTNGTYKITIAEVEGAMKVKFELQTANDDAE